ncbi:14874_t:CDS:2, partial [Racocetra fulgida]
EEINESKDKNKDEKKEEKEDYYLMVINLLQKNNFDVKTLQRLPKYSTVRISFKEYFYYLIIWHKKIKKNIKYFSYKYAISKGMDGPEIDKFEEYMRKNVKNTTSFEKYYQ